MNPIIGILIIIVIVAFMAFAVYKWLEKNINYPDFKDEKAFQIKAFPVTENFSEVFLIVEFYNINSSYRFLRKSEADRLILDSEFFATRFTTLDEAKIAALTYLARINSKVVYVSDSNNPAL